MILPLLRDRVGLVWLGLVLATLASWAVGTGHELEAPYAGVVIIVIAFIKARFIGRQFMELRYAPTGLLVVFESWLVVASVLVMGFFLLA
ncbi:MAG: cytochrome C oxidase subunit IV family protein [Ilumatobacteraceae bacterium]